MIEMRSCCVEGVRGKVAARVEDSCYVDRKDVKEAESVVGSSREEKQTEDVRV